MSPVPSSTPRAFSSRWRAALAFVAAGAVLLLGTLSVLNTLVAWEDLPASTSLSLVFLLALAVLGFSLGAFGYALRILPQRVRLNAAAITLGLAYGLPLAVFLGLSIFVRVGTVRLSAEMQQFFTLQGAFPGQPWAFIWQALILAFFGAPSALPLAAPRPLRALPAVVFGLLVGLFLGLAAAFMASLSASLLETALPAAQASLDLPLVMRIATLGVAVLVAPWAEERFFRAELLAHWEGCLGSWKADLLSAGLFALVQFRPVLILPAFLAALGLGRVVRARGRLREAVVAHAVLNAVLFGLSWRLVL